VVESTVCDGFGVRGVAQRKCALVGILVYNMMVVQDVIFSDFELEVEDIKVLMSCLPKMPVHIDQWTFFSAESLRYCG
jgi:hypothetical protein